MPRCTVPCRAVQNTKTPLLATMGANALNIALCPLLVFALKMGVRGAALATVITQIFPCWSVRATVGEGGGVEVHAFTLLLLST